MSELFYRLAYGIVLLGGAIFLFWLASDTFFWIKGRIEKVLTKKKSI